MINISLATFSHTYVSRTLQSHLRDGNIQWVDGTICQQYSSIYGTIGAYQSGSRHPYLRIYPAIHRALEQFWCLFKFGSELRHHGQTRTASDNFFHQNFYNWLGAHVSDIAEYQLYLTSLEKQHAREIIGISDLNPSETK